VTTEYHHRVIDGRRLSWDVSRLRGAAAGLEPVAVPLADIFEFDSVYWFDAEFPPTCRAVVEHARRIDAADLDDPILLSPDGYVADGMYRVAKAHVLGLTAINALRLHAYPRPDRNEPA
jgi:hypothetical protein